MNSDFLFALFVPALVLLFGCCFPLCNFSIYSKMHWPSYVTVSSNNTSVSYGHEANVLVFPSFFQTTNLSHKNLAPCLGFTKKGESVYAVPWSYEMLMQTEGTLVQKCKHCRDVAQGLLYLHEQGFCHGNLTIDKIVMANEPKILDYLDPYRGQKRDWQDQTSTRKADIYDLGVLIYMCLHNNQKPPAKIPNPQDDNLKFLYGIIKECLASNGIDRPSALDVVETLDDTIQLLQQETGELVFYS